MMGDDTVPHALDRARICHLMRIGILAACLGLAADALLGWVDGLHVGGVGEMVAAYATVSDMRLYASAILGLVGITLECLCYFGIRRLFFDAAPRLAHAYRAGILGMLAFGACGVHVPCCMAVWTYKHLAAAGVADLMAELLPWAMGFMAPAMALFELSFWTAFVVQFRAFWTSRTPYPCMAAIFTVPVGMAVVYALCHLVLPDVAPVNAISCGWISVGNLWMFGGLLATMPAENDPVWQGVSLPWESVPAESGILWKEPR